jgi:hypothetical protein
MRTPLTLAASLLAVQLLASPAGAQCIGIIPPPQAPDMFNTKPYYYNTCFGMTYGPNYCVRPPYGPFQGAIGPIQGYGGVGAPLTGPAAFPSHLYARGPRDYFMYDTDPRSSPYSYGYVRPYDYTDRGPPPPPLQP